MTCYSTQVGPSPPCLDTRSHSGRRQTPDFTETKKRIVLTRRDKNAKCIPESWVVRQVLTTGITTEHAKTKDSAREYLLFALFCRDLL